MFDLKNNIKLETSLAPILKTADVNGTGIDLKGFSSAALIVNAGAAGDTFSSTVKTNFQIEHSDDDSTYTDVAQAGIVDGTIAAGGIFLKLDGTAGGNPDTAGGVFRVEYVGNSRYIRVVLAKTGTHSNGTPIGAIVVRSGARHSGDNAFTAHNA